MAGFGTELPFCKPSLLYCLFNWNFMNDTQFIRDYTPYFNETWEIVDQDWTQHLSNIF